VVVEHLVIHLILAFGSAHFRVTGQLTLFGSFELRGRFMVEYESGYLPFHQILGLRKCINGWWVVVLPFRCTYSD